MSDKEPKKYDEMISILRDRGMYFPNKDSICRAVEHLKRNGYYNLVNGYKIPFLLKNDSGTLVEPERYKEGTSLDELYALYSFDKKLRSIFLRNTLEIEISIKSLVSYYFSLEHGYKNYLVYENFDTSQRDAVDNITKLFSEIQRQIASRSNDPSIRHYLVNHGYIPLWVLNNILTLGQISKFYSLMKQPERQSISKVFSIQDNELGNLLTQLSSVRNICAHSNRLFCYRSRRPLNDFPLHGKIEIPRTEKGEYKYGKRDLFAILIIFKILLSKNEFKRICKQIEKELRILDSKLRTIDLSKILAYMGFPDEWRDKLETV